MNIRPSSRIALLLFERAQRGEGEVLGGLPEAGDGEENGGPGGIDDQRPGGGAAGAAKTEYRYQIMLLTQRMSRLSRLLAELAAGLALPDEVKMSVDIDPVNLM